MVFSPKVQSLEGTLGLTMLLHLLEYGPQIKSVLTSQITNTKTTARSRFEDLEEAGLIEIKASTRSEGHWVSLTEKGQEIAEKIREMEAILTREG